MSIEWQLPIHSFHLNTYGTCPAIRYDYPEYDYMYAYTTLRPTVASSPSMLDEVTKFVSSGRYNLAPKYYPRKRNIFIYEYGYEFENIFNWFNH